MFFTYRLFTHMFFTHKFFTHMPYMFSTHSLFTHICCSLICLSPIDFLARCFSPTDFSHPSHAQPFHPYMFVAFHPQAFLTRLLSPLTGLRKADLGGIDRAPSVFYRTVCDPQKASKSIFRPPFFTIYLTLLEPSRQLRPQTPILTSFAKNN